MIGKPDETPRSAWAEALRISDLGLRLVFSVGVLVALGLWLDRRLAWTGFPAFAVAGAILGFGVGMVALVRGLTTPPKQATRAGSDPARSAGSVKSQDLEQSEAERATRDASEPDSGSGSDSSSGSDSGSGRRSDDRDE